MENTAQWGASRLNDEAARSTAQILYYLQDIIQLSKSRRARWVGHVECVGQNRTTHRALVGKSEGKRPLGRDRRTYTLSLKWIFNKYFGGRGGHELD